MSRLSVPIQAQVLWNTGDVLLWADLDLLLKDNSGAFHRQTFRVDTGTQLTTMSAFEAKQLSLPIPAAPSPVKHQQTGLEVRSGYLRFRIGMDQTEYQLACLFLGDPNIPPDPNQPATLPRNLLQPFALLDQLQFTIDKDPTNTGAPYGTLVVEKK